MLDTRFIETLNTYTASKYNVPPPKIRITNTLDNVGKYYVSNKTIALRPEANLHVYWHEFGHYVDDIKGKTNTEEDANRFAATEAANLGIRLEPSKAYPLSIKTDQPLGLYTLIKMKESELGMAVQNYSIKGDTLTLQFIPFYPQVYGRPYSQVQGEMNLTPIAWAILTLAATAGIGVVMIWTGNLAYNMAGVLLIWVALAGIGISVVYLVIKSLIKYTGG